MWSSNCLSSGAPEFTPGFSEVRVPRSLVFYVMFCLSLLGFCSFSLTIVSFDLLRFMASDYPFGIFKLFVAKNKTEMIEQE
jgi:hypothetical protein